MVLTLKKFKKKIIVFMWNLCIKRKIIVKNNKALQKSDFHGICIIFKVDAKGECF